MLNSCWTIVVLHHLVYLSRLVSTLESLECKVDSLGEGLDSGWSPRNLHMCLHDIGVFREEEKTMSGVLHRTLGKENPRARVGLLRGIISTYQ